MKSFNISYLESLSSEALQLFDSSIVESSSVVGIQSSPVKRRKPRIKTGVAPRAGHQYKIGPTLEDTIIVNKIFIKSSLQEAVPRLHARFDRGFEKKNDEWVGYKRNYLTLVASFDFLDVINNVVSHEQFCCLDTLGTYHDIAFFAIRISAHCYEDGTIMGLVQHTAKRDKGSTSKPPMHPLIPGPLPSHEVVRDSTNIKNPAKLASYAGQFHQDRAQITRNDCLSILDTYPEGNKIATVARYDRFQINSALDTKTTTSHNKHYHLDIFLTGVLENGITIDLACTTSPPLIIRGRSPSTYPREVSTSKRLIDEMVQKQSEEKIEEKHRMQRSKIKLEVAELMPLLPSEIRKDGTPYSELNSLTANDYRPLILLTKEISEQENNCNFNISKRQNSKIITKYDKKHKNYVEAGKRDPHNLEVIEGPMHEPPHSKNPSKCFEIQDTAGELSSHISSEHGMLPRTASAFDISIDSEVLNLTIEAKYNVRALLHSEVIATERSRDRNTRKRCKVSERKGENRKSHRRLKEWWSEI